MTDNFTKGSEWRKWDLHVHSPESNGFIGDWGQFKEQLKHADCDVIGINDYFSVAGYKKIQDEITAKTFDLDNKKILPIVEMRMTDSVQNKHKTINTATHFNFHIIFNPKIKTNDIENFIKSLKSEGTTIGSDYDDKNQLQSKKVSFSEVLKSLNEDSKFKNNFLTWLPYDEYGGIDEINPDSDGWIKSNFIKNADILGSSNQNQRDFFLWRSKLKSDNRTDKFTQNQFKDWLGAKKPCIKGSDSHNHNYPIGKLKDGKSEPIEKFCWIKADPTFEGLKQIIYEPETRVYIGEKPPILSKVENNKTNYIKSLEINQLNENHTSDIWFKDISIPFNKELVAIIGNKGSGKSGIADILGLIGNTHIDKKYFSFLHKNKFLKGKLANKFEAQIIWESSGKSDKTLLSANPKTENPESVRFIPQNYFEELANELEISKFQKVLENIIFEYIPDSEKLNKSNFEELESYKAENVNTAIQEQKSKIQAINTEIINLEKKKHPDYLKEIIGFIEQKNIEIKAQNKLLEELPIIANPNNNGEDSEQNNIAKHSTELDTLKENLKEKENSKSTLTSELEALVQFRNKIEIQKQSVDEFLEIHTEEAEKYNLNISEILKIKVNYLSINKKISDCETKLENVNIFFESTNSIKERSAESDNKSIVYKINLLTDQLKVEIAKLTGEEKAYQQNEQRKKSINEKIQDLTGNTENPFPKSLSFYKKEQAFITADLKPSLNNLREDRIKKSLEIFKKKSEIIKLYNSFKQSVDDKIAENESLLEDYDIKIDSSFNLNPDFYNAFLDFINQRKSGCFYGKEEGENKIKSIIEDSGFNDEDNIKNLLTNIINSLEENNTEVSEQLNDNKLLSFYDYVFSLDYLNPQYELKLGGKVLGQLSPGERGALLLIFYLMIDKEEIPLIIDQPEDNLDNESVYNMLSKFIKQAKKKRQIIMVTHNPNLAVGADAEQIIHVSIDKTNKHKFSFISGSIENPEINKKIVKILEGTKPAFDKRKLKYQEK